MSHDCYPFRLTHHARQRWFERCPGLNTEEAYRRAVEIGVTEEGFRYLIDPRTETQFVVRCEGEARIWNVVTMYQFQVPLAGGERRLRVRYRRERERQAREWDAGT